jgi:N-acetyl sugar amidotransferase
MDTTDPEIVFDAEGVCSHCRHFDLVQSKQWFPNAEGGQRLAEILAQVREEGRGKEYDCIIGLSGGVDSSFLALKLKELNLRPLVVHVDAGWNTELAVRNIESIVKYCGYDLHTHVMDWEDMRDLQLAYLRAGVANQDVPQDHAFFASMYHFIVKNKIKYVISGGNLATECVFPRAWHHSAMDAINLLDIHRKFGERKLRNYKTISFSQYYFIYPFVHGLRTILPLNFMPYDKLAALKELVDKVGYKPYERKHGESIFTRFFQNHYLPVRFGYDKRKPHLSSLVLSEQMIRDEAVAALEAPLYDPQELASDIQYFCRKLRIGQDEYNALMNVPLRDATEFRNWNNLHRTAKTGQRLFQRLTGRSIRAYS